MLRRNVNSYMGALLITVVGAAATLLITRTAASVDSLEYVDPYAYVKGDFSIPANTP